MTSLPERLKSETRPLHEQTEQLLYSESLRSGTLSASQYQHLLRTHLAYHQALETAIDQHPDFFEQYRPDSRRKTPWLLADIGTTLTDTTLPANEFTNWSPFALLGAAYVGEGSMLGGKTVWHLLQQSSALASLLPTARFYKGYGADTGQQWRDFGAFLTQQGADKPDEVVEGARQAFLTYQNLFRWTAGK
ncbi:biliverdin-producing heme oxygenase [Spirosoma sp. BT702]|uniref:Biliverdin-producing heme oxygenase n=1 Tax=Spirosoma profusum TaxID=2771354 RepID=A0A926Y0H4_9BACT|nr:biliverdin-producing heme oxygenase [Spirosoma profusum]MBD2704212.1 biliverdin-producing heme oxygenase [Spirosoma profusum]